MYIQPLQQLPFQQLKVLKKMLSRKKQKQNQRKPRQRNNSFLFLIGFILVISLVGCKGEDKKKAVQPAPPKSAPAPAATEQQKPVTAAVKEQKPQTQTGVQPGKPQKEDAKKAIISDTPENLKDKR